MSKPLVFVTDTNWQYVIGKCLEEGNLSLAWQNFIDAAVHPKGACSIDVLCELLKQIDEQARARFSWFPIEDTARQTITEDDLTFHTTNRLENLLSRFVVEQKGDVYTLDVHGKRALRLYRHLGEPMANVRNTPTAKSIQAIQASLPS